MEGKEMALLPNEDEWKRMKDIALVAVKSGLLPDGIKTPEAAMIIALKGRELGLAPMVAYSHIHVIKGKPTMSAEIMLAHIYKDHPKAEITIEESTETKCVITAKRPGAKKESKFEWTIERAAKMGLTGKDNWKKQPATMLKWRAISEMKRTVFPEVLMGIDYTPDELQEQVGAAPVPHQAPETPKDVTPTKTVADIVDDSQGEAEVQKKTSTSTVPNHAPTPEEIAEKKIAAAPPKRDLSKVFSKEDEEWKNLVQFCKENQSIVPFEFFTQHIADNYGIADYKTMTRQQLIEVLDDFETIVAANEPPEEGF